MSTFDLGAASVETTIDAITLPVEAIRQTVPTRGVRAMRPAIQAPVDTIALLIQSILDAIAAIFQAVPDAVARIRERGATDDEEYYTNSNGFPCVHVRSPLYPYKVRLSVPTTAPA